MTFSWMNGLGSHSFTERKTCLTIFGSTTTNTFSPAPSRKKGVSQPYLLLNRSVPPRRAAMTPVYWDVQALGKKSLETPSHAQTVTKAREPVWQCRGCNSRTPVILDTVEIVL